jgi:hypothetical protein
MSGLHVPPQIVESFLLAVQTDPDSREVILTFRAPAADHAFRLRARGVESLLINEFLEQNIVHELRIAGEGSQPQDLRDALTTIFVDQAPTSEGISPTLRAQLDEHAAAIVAGRKVLLEVEPVYGASVLLIAEGVEWIDPI